MLAKNQREEIVTLARKMINQASLARVDYVEVVDTDNFANRLKSLGPNSVLVIAVFFGKNSFDRQYSVGMKEYDFAVIGSGIAGLSFALKAARHGSVAVVTKRKGADTNTAWAQGGIACVTSDEDSFELHVRDTLEAGAGLCDEAVVRTIVTEGPERIRELAELGVQFDQRRGLWSS